MAFYQVDREDESGYASAIVRAHGSRQALAAVSHLGFTAKNAFARRIDDGRGEPNAVLSFVEETAPVVAPSGESTAGLYDHIG